MIKIKREFKNALGIDVCEIYADKQILETTNQVYWNATKEEPIGVTKSRLNDYVESEKEIEKKE